MHQKLIQFNKTLRATRSDIPALEAGDIVKIFRKIKEAGKERTQIFQGMVIAVKGGQSSSPMLTVRKVSSGVGVELVFPLYSPQIEKIELMKRTKARRGKLYYVRTKSAKVLGKKLKEVPFAVGKAGAEVSEMMKEAKQVTEVSAESTTKAQSEEKV